MVGERGEGWLRETATTREAYIGTGIFAAMWVGVAVLVGLNESLVWVVPCLAIAAVFGLLGYRAGRAGLLITRDEVVIRSTGKTQHIPLAHVNEFKAGILKARRPRYTPGILLVTVHGEELPVWALSKRSVVWKLRDTLPPWGPVADDLNRRLEAARRGAAPTARAAASSGSSRAPAAP